MHCPGFAASVGAAGFKEFLEQRPAFLFQQPTGIIRLMIELRALQNLENRHGSAPPRIIHTPHHTRDTGKNDGARAHGTGFLGYVQHTVRQPPVTDFRSSLRNGNDLSMRRRILEQFYLVTGLSNHVAFMNNYCAYRYLPGRSGALRKPQRKPHKPDIRAVIQHAEFTACVVDAATAFRCSTVSISILLRRLRTGLTLLGHAAHGTLRRRRPFRLTVGIFHVGCFLQIIQISLYGLLTLLRQ